MYNLILVLHSYTRWVVIVVMFYSLFVIWRAWLKKAEWTKVEDFAALAFTWVITIQFIFGLILYFYPVGLAQVALQVMSQDFSAAMKTRDIRFFGMEHPLQMVISVIVVHFGSARARKTKNFRWALICFTLALVLILLAIPWWRPLLRM